MLDAFKGKWFRKPIVHNHQASGNYAQRDIPSVDITSVVVYGHNPDGSIQKVKDFTFAPIHMMDGDSLEMKIKLDTNFGIADVSEMFKGMEPEPVVELDELEERVAYWNSKL